MRNLKKLVLLLSILAAFAISCKNAQQSVNSSFDVIEDGTAEPSTPPVDITPKPGDQRKNFPGEAELWIDRSDINTLVYGKGQNYTIKIETSDKYQGTSGGTIFQALKTFDITTQKTVVEKTAGAGSAEDILKNITFEKGPFQHNSIHYIDINWAMASALGESGQYAKVKLTLFFDDHSKPGNDSGKYKPGSRDIYITVKRR